MNAAMDQICNKLTKKGDRIGYRLVKTITARAADKLCDKFIEREDGERLPTDEKLVVLCRKAWRVVRPTNFRRTFRTLGPASP